MLQINDHCLQFSSLDGVADYLTVQDADTHSHVMFNRFTNVQKCSASLSSDAVDFIGSSVTACSTVLPIVRDLPCIKRTFARVHSHVCGHASYSHMRTLLQRNKN